MTLEVLILAILVLFAFPVSDYQNILPRLDESLVGKELEEGSAKDKAANGN